MEKKKICLMFNQFQLQDGICRSAIAISNIMAKRDDVEITLMPLFRYENRVLDYLDKRVKVKPVFRFYFRGFAQLFKIIPASWLYKLLVNNRYDIDVAFQFGPAQPIMAAGVNSKHRTIGWMHGYDTELTYKDCYKKMEQVVCVSKCNADRLRKEMNNSIKVDYNYNPIDDVNVRNQGKEQIDIVRPESMLFVSVARMSPEKGYMRLLDVVQKLKEDGLKFHLWLVGDGPVLPELKKHAEDLSINDYVTFVGQQSNPHAFTAKADVFICSSFNEGYSTACTEAAMLGVPVISTNVSGAEEIIADAACGKVVESEEEAIYSAMKEVIEQPFIVDEWKEVLKSTYKNFSPDERIKRFCKILEL